MREKSLQLPISQVPCIFARDEARESIRYNHFMFYRLAPNRPPSPCLSRAVPQSEKFLEEQPEPSLGARVPGCYAAFCAVSSQ